MTLLNYLTEKPIIGGIGGISSGGFLFIRSFLLDEKILQLVSALGVYAGFTLCFLTILLKLIEILSKFKTKTKTKNEETIDGTNTI
jgi:hypothetical protein